VFRGTAKCSPSRVSRRFPSPPPGPQLARRVEPQLRHQRNACSWFAKSIWRRRGQCTIVVKGRMQWRSSAHAKTRALSVKEPRVASLRANGGEMRRTTCKRALILMALIRLGAFSQPATAQSECAATNDNDDQICNVSCPLGEAATCKAGIGSSAPKCACSGAPVSLDPAASEYGETSASSTNGH
jgi:hypothetical protein